MKTLNDLKNNEEREYAIRLYYIALEKFTRYCTRELKIGQTSGVSSPFRLPKGMSISEACKVASYLSEKVEKEQNLQPACEKSVIAVSKILEDYGFEKIESQERGHYHAVFECLPSKKHILNTYPAIQETEGVVDLFTVGGDFNIFKYTDLYDRYFDWFTEGVTQEEINAIYEKIENERE